MRVIKKLKSLFQKKGGDYFYDPFNVERGVEVERRNARISYFIQDKRRQKLHRKMYMRDINSIRKVRPELAIEVF